VKNRTHSIDFKRQVEQDYLAGEPLHSLAKRHDLSRNLIRIWVRKYEARIAALERLVGKQALELEFLKGL
jgi:transposase-like protein